MRNTHSLESVACPLCKYTGIAPLTTFPDSRTHVIIHVSYCMQCGFTHLNPRWPQEEYDVFYRHAYDQYLRPKEDVENELLLEKRRGQEIASRLKEMKNIATPKRILDVGAGFGYVLTEIQTRLSSSAQLFAIETSVQSDSFFTSQGISKLSAKLEDIDTVKSGTFDLIIMRHVLEHLLDPILGLQKINELLSPDGFVYIAVPDIINPLLPVTKSVMRVVHTLYFSPETLRYAAEKAGLSCILQKKGFHEVYVVCRKSLNQSNPVLPQTNAHELEALKKLLRHERSLAHRVAQHTNVSVRRVIQYLRRIMMKV